MGRVSTTSWSTIDRRKSGVRVRAAQIPSSRRVVRNQRPRTRSVVELKNAAQIPEVPTIWRSRRYAARQVEARPARSRCRERWRAGEKKV